MRNIFDTPYLSGPKRINGQDYRRLVGKEKSSLAKLGGMDVEWLAPTLAGSNKKFSVTRIAPAWKQLPAELAELSKHLQESRCLLSLREDWDGDGAPAFQRIHWERIATFLASAAAWLWREHRLKLAPPQIVPLPDGGIDVHWRTGQVELLMNFPADADRLLNFYGDDYGSQKLKGTTSLARDNRWIVLWLMGK